MGEIHRPSALRFLQQDVDELLPHAAALVFAQAPVAGLRRGGDVVGQVFPLTAGLEHGQDAIENFPFVCPGPSPRLSATRSAESPIGHPKARTGMASVR